MTTSTFTYYLFHLCRKKLLFSVLIFFSLLCTFSLSTAQEATWQWAKSTGSSGKDAFTAVGRNSTGDFIFTAGYFSNSMILGPSVLTSAGGTDVIVARYHPTGAPIWSLRFGGTGNDAATSLAIDGGGNVYVAGSFENRMIFGTDTLTSAGGTDIFIAKYSSGGNYLWAKRAGGPGNDIANAVAVDAAGNVFIAGAFSDSVRFGNLAWMYSAGSSDMFIAQYTYLGVVQWSARAGGIGNDFITALAVNSSGLYTAGSFTDSLTVGADMLKSSGNTDIFLAKFSTSGSPQWARKAGGIASDAANTIALDIAGNVLIGGKVGDSAIFGSITTGRYGGQDGFIAQYTSSGGAQWARIMGGAGDDNVTSIGADSTGAVFCTGYFSETASIGGRSIISAGLTDAFVAKYSSIGYGLWSQRGGGTDADASFSLNVDNNRSSYICGTFYYEATYGNTILGGQGDYDMFIARLTNVETNDVGVADILFPPAPFIPNATQVAAIIQNYGTGIMDTVQIEWEFNGVSQTKRYSGKDLAPGQRDTIQLGSPIFPEKMFSLVTARTLLPNNATDPNPSNDEFSKAMGPGLIKGTYTLGGISPDFTTFTEAARYLNVCGVLDTVIIEVRQGNYNEQFILRQIPGLSPTNQLLIRKQAGQANRPQLSFAPIYPNNNYTMLLNGTDWVTIKGLAINAAGDKYNRAALLAGGTTGIILDSIAFASPVTAISDGCLMIDPANDCSGLTVANNEFYGGVYGFIFTPISTANNLNIKNNRFENYSMNGLGLSNARYSIIRGNTFHTTSENTTGISLSAISSGTQIIGNAIREIPSGTGIRLLNSAGTPTAPLLVANNMVLIGAGNVAAQGIAIDTSRLVNIYHNTINQTSTAPAESGFKIRSGDSINVVNNLFYNSGGGYAYSIQYAVPNNPILRSNYNCLYSAGPILGIYRFDDSVVLAANLNVWRSSPIGLDSHSVSKVITFLNDLTHLSAVDSMLFGDTALRTVVTTDIDNQPRKSPYMGADEVIPKITIVSQTDYRQIFCLGSTATFYVNATITLAGKLHYQWQMNGQDIPDSTNSTITFTNVNRNSEAFFRCVITGNSGADTVISDRIQLLVINATEITHDPKTRYLLPGQTAEFEVLAEASPPNGANQVIYKWFRNGSQLANSQRIAGATTSLLKIFNVQLSDVDSNYYCTVDGACGSDTSKRFSLLMPGAAFEKQPKDTSVCSGDTAVFAGSVMVGIPGQELRYEWQRGGVPLTNGSKYSGSDTKSLFIMNVNPSDTGGNYRLKVLVVATGAILYSDEVAIHLYPPTSIASPLDPALACESKPYTFTIKAIGVDLFYQWQRNDTNIAGENADTYTISEVKKSYSGKYRVVVTGKCGTITSNAVDLTIKAVPFVIVNPPKTYTANIGKLLTLTVNIGGPTPIRYKWYHNGVELPNQASNILILDSAKKTDTGYYWCIAENDCGTIKTDSCLVYVEPLSVENDIDTKPTFEINSILPNPAEGIAVIYYSVAVPGYVRLAITDALGREVLIVYSGNSEPGKNAATFDVSHLSAGRYYCVMTTPTGSVSLPITILR